MIASLLLSSSSSDSRRCFKAFEGESINNSVTLLLEMQQKEFTSDKPIYPLQFGTIIHIMGLSLTFKTIK